MSPTIRRYVLRGAAITGGLMLIEVVITVALTLLYPEWVFARAALLQTGCWR